MKFKVLAAVILVVLVIVFFAVRTTDRSPSKLQILNTTQNGNAKAVEFNNITTKAKYLVYDTNGMIHIVSEDPSKPITGPDESAIIRMI